MQKRSTPNFLITFLFLLLGAGYLSAATLTVTSTVDGDPGSLSDVISASASGDVIVFDPSTDGIAQAITSPIFITGKSLTINGNGIGTTIIEGNNNNGIFDVTDSNINADNLTIRGGTKTDGSGAAMLLTNSNVSLDEVLFFDNQTTNLDPSLIIGGGAIAMSQGCLLTMTDCEFIENQAIGAFTSGGAIYNAGGRIIMEGGAFEENTTDLFGGAIVSGNAGSELNLRNVDFEENEANATANGDGGAVWISGSTRNSFFGCNFSDNRAERNGGALWTNQSRIITDFAFFSDNVAAGPLATNGGGAYYNASGSAVIRNGNFIGNEATGESGSGGAIFNATDGVINIDNTGLATNNAERAGGAIENNGGAGSRIRLTDVTMTSNDAGTNPGNGGGIHVTGMGRIIINDGTYNGNVAAEEGGGLWNGTGLMVINGAQILNNTAAGDESDQGGGGIFNAGGTLRITNASITQNTATGTSGSGGGIFNAVGGAIKIFDSSIEDNTAVRAGGGIEDNSGLGTKVNLQRVDLLNNTTGGAPGNGGGLHVTGNGEVVIGDCTVNGNIAAAEGGGVWNGTGIMRINNTSFTNNTAGGNEPDQGGGGIFNAGGDIFASDISVSDCNATGTSGSGGGILNDADGFVRVLRATIDNCSANRAGGGIESNGGEFYLFRSEVVDCAAGSNPGYGGGVHSTGFSQIIDSEVHFNAAVRGGGLWNGGNGTMQVLTSTIDFNDIGGVTGSRGGGIRNQSGSLSMTMSTIANNSASAGSAISIAEGTVSLQSCTVARNTSTGTTMPGGIALAPDAEMTLANTVVALNNTLTGAPFDLSGQGMISSKGWNFIGADNSIGIFASGAASTDQFGTQATPIDPNLGQLQSNGGFTTTIEILCPSPLIDAGNPGYQDDDQRDQPVFGGRKDIGAYEAQFGCPEPFAGDIEQLEVADETFRTSVYPNPVTSGRATVRIPTTFGENVTLRVVNMAGMVILERQAFAVNEELDLARLPKGTYTLQVISATSTESHRVIVSQ